MPTPTATKSITRRLSGLTGKGQAVVLLIAVRDRWELLSPPQQAECSELLGRLRVALRGETCPESGQVSRPLPLVGRLSA